MVLLEVPKGHFEFSEGFTELFPFKNDSQLSRTLRSCKINVKEANIFSFKILYLVPTYKENKKLLFYCPFKCSGNGLREKNDFPMSQTMYSHASAVSSCLLLYAYFRSKIL